MTDDDLAWSQPADDPTRPERPAKTCRHPRAFRKISAISGLLYCQSCDKAIDPAASRRGRTNRARGNREELTVARKIGGRKMGPLGLPWDVEMPGYARLQVKKLASAPSLRFVAGELARIGSGAEMPGFVWIEPGRGGEALIVFRLADFAERHGVKVE